MSLSMWFLLIAQIRRKMHKCRMKKISLLEKNSLRIPSIQCPYTKKRHLCAPSLYASYTVEAAMVIPIFLGLMIFAIFYMRILQVEYGIQKVLDETSQQAAVLCSGEDTISLGELRLLCTGRMTQENIPLSYIKGGILGISFGESTVEGNYIVLRVSYDVDFPVWFFGNLQWNRRQQSVNRKWIGWDKDEEGAGGTYVYVTEYGTVYHLQRHCPYLNPGIMAIPYRQVTDRRNESGARYKACKGCGAKKVNAGVVYITEYGEMYHRTLRCKGLRRTIHRILITDVGNRELCRKCKEE